MTSPSAVALVGQDDEGIRHLPVIPTAQKLALALPSLEELKVLQAYGQMFAESGLFPKVQTWQAAAAIIQYGAQLGIDAFTALKDIYWIEGKPTCDASLINSLIKRDHGDDAIMPVVADRTVCTIRFKRRGWDHHEEVTVRYEDYAHLHGKTNWKTSPADMLWARNVSQIGRRHFSDTIKGLYTRDEMLDATEASYRVVEAAVAPPSQAMPQAQDEASPPPPAAAVDADEPTTLKALDPKIVKTWLDNIAKARSIDRLDQITETLVNLGMMDIPELADALSARLTDLGQST